VTFNWDTLLDRALKSNTAWKTDHGYGVEPKKIYRNSWVTPTQDSGSFAYPKLIKLHGSTNWLTSYPTEENGAIELMWNSPSDTMYVFENTVDPYPTYDGRYISGYEEFSYGYYPPNLPENTQEKEGHVLVSCRLNQKFEEKYPEIIKSSSEGLVSMPLIIPPVKKKEYSLFGSLFNELWGKAKNALINADSIYIIGYSFPKTDYKSKDLFKSAFLERKTMPDIIIVNPNPDDLEELFKFEFGINSKHLHIRKEYFDKSFTL
jgi:hypothetical protein